MIQKRTLGSMRAAAPLRPGSRAAPAFPLPPAPLPGTYVMAGEAAARPGAEEGPAACPAPGARASCAGSPSPRARCSVSPRASPGDPVSPGFPHVTICQLLGSRAPAARRHHLPSPQIPHLYPQWSCEPCSPTESCYNHAPPLRVAR